MRFFPFLLVFSLPAWGLTPAEWAERKPHSIEKGLSALTTVPRGRSIFEGLEKLREEGKLKFDSTFSEAGRRAGAGSHHSGGFAVDTIYLDENVPFVAFVATIVHEGTHALEFLAEEGGGEKLKHLTAEIRLHSEHRAYRAQDTFLAELIAQDERLKEVIQEAVDFRYLFDYPISETTFRSFFDRLPVSVVDSYLQRNPYDRLK